nr:hypothetical protein [uncultured Merdimonas sp.]
MYKVIKHFHDLQDATKTKSGEIYHEYNVGDEYPRKGFKVSEDRLKELAGKDNKQGTPLIAEVKEETPVKK